MVNRFFDINKHTAPKVKEPEGHGVYISKYLAQHYQKIEKLQRDLVRIPTQGEIFYLQSDGSFNAFTFITMLCKCMPIKQLHASTYSLSRKVIEALMELHDCGAIEQITLLVNDGMIARNPVTMDNLASMAKSRPNVHVQLAWVHAKVSLLQTHDNYYVIEGSGNWADNAQYEQYVFSNDKGAYDFRMKLFTEIKSKPFL
ncbi:hypothetical protein ACLI1A_10180 [Flavobacterium sp. RHBU_3]|uniref:hypothetical protein n=1 Tax=Flavobacterium sp. RHBU_3 TaxID=3391184 RepID=UPI0039856B1B